MKTLLKLGIVLLMFGVMLSVLGVGVIRVHAVKPIPVTAAAPASAASATSASAIASPPAKP
jgi:hypothetical protein